jgi:hypothetical protein
MGPSWLIRGAIAFATGAALVAATPADRMVRRPADSFVFGGRVFTADGGSLDGVRVVASDSRGSYETVMDSSGMFVGSLPALPMGRVTLRVSGDSAAPPRYHTSVITLGPGVSSDPTRIVLVPMRWRIRGGAYDGRDVPIDPTRATASPGDGPGFWRLTRRGRLSGHAVSWVPDSFPVRVAFRHERSDPFISASDSVRFWEMARNLEAVLGRNLFRPASFEEVDSGADGIFVTVNRRMPSAGKTFVTYDESGRIYEALVTVGLYEYLGQSRVAMHEMMHAIGFGHTRGWTSVMGPNAEGVDAPTAEDVAYAQLYYAISELQRNREVRFGIPEAGRN